MFQVQTLVTGTTTTATEYGKPLSYARARARALRVLSGKDAPEAVGIYDSDGRLREALHRAKHD
jgi:hypothetical protein